MPDEERVRAAAREHLGSDLPAELPVTMKGRRIGTAHVSVDETGVHVTIQMGGGSDSSEEQQLALDVDSRPLEES